VSAPLVDHDGCRVSCHASAGWWDAAGGGDEGAVIVLHFPAVPSTAGMPLRLRASSPELRLGLTACHSWSACMNAVRTLVILVVLAAGCQRSGPVGPSATAKKSSVPQVSDFEALGVDPKVIVAWKLAGAEFGWFTPFPDPIGDPEFSLERRQGVPALPAFSAKGLNPRRLLELPAPETAFGLDFGRTTLTADDLKALGRFRQVRILNLLGTQIGDADLKALAGLHEVQTLILAGNRLSDEALKELVGFERLERLNLGTTDVTGAGLGSLAALPQLHTLRLYGTKITNAGLKELKSLKQLRILDLHLTKISDAGIKDLSQTHQLQTLFVAGADITEAGLAELRKALPKCDVRR
jgi:hypothetical protein